MRAFRKVRKVIRKASERFRKLRKASESFGKLPNDTEFNELEKKVKGLEEKKLGLEIANKARDIVIGQLKEERELFIDKMENNAQLIGELKTRLQLEPPKEVEIKEEEKVKTYILDNEEENKEEPGKSKPQFEEKESKTEGIVE